MLLDRVRAAADPTRVRIVTADRQLANRARHRGAEVVAPHAFVARCGASPSLLPTSEADPEEPGGN